uniref:Nuclear autoantigenic sperm protein n=1 Tax=Salvator merianae TaxID=96440 RepID=A0A8D0DYR5_SALMN
MAEESAAPSTSAEKTESMDVDGEAKKLLGLGQKNLVMGDIPSAVNAFQEAASLLMENGVLGNALEGVQVEEEEEKAEDSMVESADNIDEEAREELREQVYNAMEEKDESQKTAEETQIQTVAEMQKSDVEMEEVEEQPKEPAAGVEHTNPTEKEDDDEKAEKNVEGTVQEKEGLNKVTIEKGSEDAVVSEEKLMDAEGVAAAEELVVVKDSGEHPTVKKAVVEHKAPEEVKQVAQETAKQAGEGTTVEKQLGAGKAAGVEKADEAAVLEKIEEKAEKQAEAVEKPVVEELVKASGESAAAEVVTSGEKLEGQVDSVENQVAKAIDEKIKDVEAATEQVVADPREELKESFKEEVLFSAPDENTPTESIKHSHELETEETAEVAAKVETKEEKDVKKGEGEEVEGSEEDKIEEDKENDSTVEDKENDSTVEDKENDSTVEEDKENDSAVEEKESEEDEVGNLELAWDMLELAKVIYKRQDTKEAQLHAAQAHLKLGEVSIESENYVQAIEEFHSCLTLQQKYLEAHDRLLAETHYHLGLAYHYNNQYDEAVLQFSKSVEVIDKRMVMLTDRLKTKGEGEGLTDDEKEIEELKGLLPEIKEKIEDSKESQKSAKVAELALKATLVGGSSSSFSQGTESSLTSTIPAGQKADGTSQCVTDISHLVRKKRKPEEETQQGDNEAKKSKPEPAVNGGGDAAPSGNEVAEKMEEETEGQPQVETVQSAV